MRTPQSSTICRIHLYLRSPNVKMPTSYDLTWTRRKHWLFLGNVWTETSYITVRILQMFVSIYKRYAIDIADPSSMQDACHMNFVIEPLWLSGKASERWIQRSEVRFLMGTQIFFLCPTLVTRWKLKIYHLSYFYPREWMFGRFFFQWRKKIVTNADACVFFRYSFAKKKIQLCRSTHA